MNILYINHYAGSIQMGMEFRPYYLSREWTRMGHSVRIVTADYSHLRIKNPSVENDYDSEDIDGITYTYIKTGRYDRNGVARGMTMLRFVYKLYRDAKSLARKWQPDVVISSSTYPIDTYAAQRISRYAGATLIHEIHDMWPITLIEQGMSRYHPFVVAMQMGENSFCKHSDYVVSLPIAAKDYLVEHGMSPEKFVPLLNGVVEEDWESPEALGEEPDTLIRQFREKHGFIICFFGSHTISYAIEYLIRAVQQLDTNDIGVVFVGSGDYKKELIEISKQRHEDRFLFVDPIPKKQIPSMLELMDAIYVGLFDRENLGRFGIAMNKLFDSMMSGKPILYAVHAQNNMIEEYGCGITIKPEDVNALRTAIMQMYHMPLEARLQMGANGHRAIMEHYTYGQLASRFAELFVKKHS